MLPAPALPVGCVLVVAGAPHSLRQRHTLRKGLTNREKVKWCLENRGDSLAHGGSAPIRFQVPPLRVHTKVLCRQDKADCCRSQSGIQ